MWKLIKRKHTYGKLHPGFSRTTELSNVFFMLHIAFTILGLCLDLGFRKYDPN